MKAVEDNNTVQYIGEMMPLSDSEALAGESGCDRRVLPRRVSASCERVVHFVL
jgi:hypothetical protein